MAFWLIPAAIAVGYAAYKAFSDDDSSSSSSSEREKREFREREIEQENQRRREEVRKHEREESKRRRQAQIKAKQDYARHEALSLFKKYNLSSEQANKMAEYSLKENSDAKDYAMKQWNNAFSKDRELSELKNRRKALNQLQLQLKG